MRLRTDCRSGYHMAMSAKEALLERVTRLTEDEAAEVKVGDWVDGETPFRRH